ncbi:MAG: hypothetical protein A3G41_06255 [Elusimicrobia bacterium RIFCSPLOWO2_12_FULL_59_9]|nr:MAG: hypothetical protein A3G41_06255 [Elusimicrobia bacterium RIFCSPLOWO2_12_FULL_59_9]
MPEENKDSTAAPGCHRKCGGCKFLAGVLVGLLLAGTGFGLYMAGRCSGRACPTQSMCPMQSQMSK